MAMVDIPEVLARVRERCLASGGPVPPPASPSEIGQAEARLGFALPPALRLLHLEVANGGVGPVPLYGVGPGRRSTEGEDLVGVYEGMLRPPRQPYPDRPGGRSLMVAVDPWPAGVLPLSEPHDGVLFCLDALGGAVLSGEGALELGLRHADWLQREAPSLEAWLVRWLDGEAFPHRPQGAWGGR